jgi:hypothetical protein
MSNAGSDDSGGSLRLASPLGARTLDDVRGGEINVGADPQPPPRALMIPAAPDIWSLR